MKNLALRLAHSLRNRFGSWSSCLKYAWKLTKLKVAMKASRVEFSYRKVDGTIRRAIGTLDIPYTSTRAVNPNVVTYWDIESAGFRCFKIENLI